MNVFVSDATAKGVRFVRDRDPAPADARPEVPIHRLPSGRRTAAATPGAPRFVRQASIRASSLAATSSLTGGGSAASVGPESAATTKPTRASARTAGRTWVTAATAYDRPGARRHHVARPSGTPGPCDRDVGTGGCDDRAGSLARSLCRVQDGWRDAPHDPPWQP